MRPYYQRHKQIAHRFPVLIVIMDDKRAKRRDALELAADRTVINLAYKSKADVDDIRRIASGVYGVTYVVPASSPLLPYVLAHAGRVISPDTALHDLTAAAAATENVVLKLAHIRSPQLLHDFVRENIMHWALYHAKHDDVAGCRLTPQYFFGGQIRVGDTDWYATVMSFVPGETVREYMTRKGGLSASDFARIEQAVADLWTLGVAHADLHSSNVMYHSPSKTVTILDFGFAVPLSAGLLKRIRNHEHDVAVDKSVLYKQVLSRYVTNVIQRRIPGLNNFNEDGGMLRRLKLKTKGNALRARSRLLTQNNESQPFKCNSFPTIDAVTRELINSIFTTINSTNGRRLGPRNSRTRYVDNN